MSANYEAMLSRLMNLREQPRSRMRPSWCSGAWLDSDLTEPQLRTQRTKGSNTT
jgi:hypothetical protein